MGFLQQDTNNIILDAVLTNEGRKRLAANDCFLRKEPHMALLFNILTFSLSRVSLLIQLKTLGTLD